MATTKKDLAQWRHEGYSIYQGRGVTVWVIINKQRKEFPNLVAAKAAINYVTKKVQ